MLRHAVVAAFLALFACHARPPDKPAVFSGYRLLADGSYHAAMAPPRYGFYILGNVMGGDEFHPVGEVQGAGEVVEAGTSGWMELIDGSFHPSSSTGPRPEAPYVAGVMSQDGIFSPTSRRVAH